MSNKILDIPSDLRSRWLGCYVTYKGKVHQINGTSLDYLTLIGVEYPVYYKEVDIIPIPWGFRNTGRNKIAWISRTGIHTTIKGASIATVSGLSGKNASHVFNAKYKTLKGTTESSYRALSPLLALIGGNIIDLMGTTVAYYAGGKVIISDKIIPEYQKVVKKLLLQIRWINEEMIHD